MAEYKIIIDVILLIGALQGFILCIPLLRYNHNRMPNRILVGFLILLALDLIFVFVNNSSVVLQYPGLYNLNASFPFLFTPIMYLYVSVLTGKITRFRLRYLFNTLPFLIHLAFMFFEFYGLSDSNKLDIISATQATGRLIDRKMFFLLPSGPLLPGLVLLCLSAIGYGVGITKRIMDYRRELQNFYSDIKNKIFGLLILCLITTVSIWVLVATVLITGAMDPVYPTIIYTIAIYAGMYKLVTIPEVFSANRTMTDLLKQNVEGEKDKQEIVLQKFEAYLKESKAHLDQDLTISDISKVINIPVHQLSRALNSGLKKNFYQCINERRIEESKQMLTDPRMTAKSILAIGLEAGFNSKSTFNEVFKKFVGLTPSEFRKTLKS